MYGCWRINREGGRPSNLMIICELISSCHRSCQTSIPISCLPDKPKSESARFTLSTEFVGKLHSHSISAAKESHISSNKDSHCKIMPRPVRHTFQQLYLCTPKTRNRTNKVSAVRLMGVSNLIVIRTNMLLLWRPWLRRQGTHNDLPHRGGQVLRMSCLHQ